MCLLFFKPANVRFSDEQLADFWKRNQDGFGVMYAKDGKLVVAKALGGVQDWIKFHREHEMYDSCWHTRMRTHGDIDLENTHPYTVFGEEGEVPTPVAMMHNGVLRMGNSADPSKSDTWHYIRNYIRPLTSKDPSVIFSKEFGEIIGKHIGDSNKFALMDHTGRVQLVNKDAGIEWGGCWFSNTYAWDSRNEKLYPGISKSHKWGGYNGYYAGPGSRTYSGSRAWDDYDDYYGGRWDSSHKSSGSTTSTKSTTSTTSSKQADKLPVIGKKSKKKKGRVDRDAIRSLENVQLPKKTQPRPAQGALHLPAPIAGVRNYTDWDIDYICETLVEDLPIAAQSISVEQVEALLATLGAGDAAYLLEQAVVGDIKEDDLAEMFRDQRKATAYINTRKKSAVA